MAKKIIDYKLVDMTDEEFDYYSKLLLEFTFEQHSGKDFFVDLFDVDENGIITFIKPPMKKQVPWAVIIFVQNLMLNQHIRKMEKDILLLKGQ